MFGGISRLFRRAPARTYLDYAAATPVHPDVLRAMRPYFSDAWANPGAIHREGVEAREAVEESRTAVARTLRVRPEDVIFTSGGTESNNLALVGVVKALRARGRAFTDMQIISTRIEHPSVREALAALEEQGVSVAYATVQDSGRVDMGSLQALLSEKTVLVSIAYVNSEIGVIEDIKKISRAVRTFNTAHGTRALVHVDASQAPLWLSCAMDMLGADLLTLDAGKCYGPKGVGVLARRHSIDVDALTYGGGQEGGLRSGTENVPLIVGCAAALQRAQDGYQARSEKVTVIRDHLLVQLETHIPEYLLNGSREYRVANNINISLPGFDSEYAILWLDAHGVAASTKSACGAAKGNGSEVVRVITRDEARALSTIRFTLGEETTTHDVEKAVRALASHLERMRDSIDS